ncbi:hypothetical protein OUZ56_030105 [Daphnia magna]|uniref:Uncharacterized protein n=1 Tax=Daphnia magna TaxID=35525 RepID=A0ABQ9ZR62_9CRUS|nr:hypothetical protein OUZ56_030105 [Daphnia magna]
MIAHKVAYLARKNEKDVLGESSKRNEEFDHQARLFLKRDQVYRHNDLLLVIVTKCHSLCQPSPYVYHGVKHKPIVVSWVDKIRPTVVHQRKVKSCKIKPITVTRQAQPKNKPLGVNFHEIQFLCCHLCIPRTIEKPQVRYCSQDLTVLDAGLFLQELIVAIATIRKGYPIRETKIFRLAKPPHVSAAPPDNSECRTRLGVLSCLYH